MKNVFIACLFFVGLNTSVYCGQINRIELTDGSIINGEIVSYAKGVYVINTASFGEIKVEAAKISKIESSNSPSSAAVTGPSVAADNFTQSEVNAYKQKVMGNPESTAIIAGLVNDPQILEAAQDPQIQNAVKSGDIQALMKNEKFMNITNNPKMKEAVTKLKQ